MAEESYEYISTEEDIHNFLKNIDCRGNFGEDGWKFYDIISKNGKLKERYGNFSMIVKKLSGDETKPNLVVLPGFSKKSFCNTSKKILTNIDKIRSLFNSVYIICFGTEIKEMQNESCNKRDEICKKYHIDQKPYINNEKFSEIYQFEEQLLDDISQIIDKILRALEIKNVYILGKCAGGGVSIRTILKSDIYKGLLLAVPGSPTNVEKLKDLEDEKLKNLKFRFVWNIHDKFNYHWKNPEEYEEKLKKDYPEIFNEEISSSESRVEIYRYNKTMEQIKKERNIEIDYKYLMLSMDEGNEKLNHEIPDGFFNESFIN